MEKAGIQPSKKTTDISFQGLLTTEESIERSGKHKLKILKGLISKRATASFQNLRKLCHEENDIPRLKDRMNYN